MENFYVIKLHVQVTNSYDKDLHVKDPDRIAFKFNIIIHVGVWSNKKWKSNKDTRLKRIRWL